MVETHSGISTTEPKPGRELDTARNMEPPAGGLDPATGMEPAAGSEQPGTPVKRLAHTTGTAGGTGVDSSAMYTMLALSHALLAIPCIFAPKAMARAMFGRAADPPEDQHTHLLGLLSCGLLSGTAICLGLEEQARRHTLRTFTSDTLKAALVAFAAGNILLQLYYPATLTPLAAIALALAMAGTLALPASQLLGRDDLRRVSRDFRRLPHNLREMATLRAFSVPGALYLLLTLVFPLAGLAYFMAPKWTLYHTFGYVYGKSTQFLWKAVGGGLMTLLPAITATLKDKAENDLLGRALARTLNLGLMLASIGHLLVFGPILAQRHGGFLLPLLTSTWATALLASMAGLAAPAAAAEGAGATGGRARGRRKGKAPAEAGYPAHAEASPAEVKEE